MCLPKAKRNGDIYSTSVCLCGQKEDQKRKDFQEIFLTPLLLFFGQALFRVYDDAWLLTKKKKSGL